MACGNPRDYVSMRALLTLVVHSVVRDPQGIRTLIRRRDALLSVESNYPPESASIHDHSGDRQGNSHPVLIFPSCNPLCSVLPRFASVSFTDASSVPYPATDPRQGSRGLVRVSQEI